MSDHSRLKKFKHIAKKIFDFLLSFKGSEGFQFNKLSDIGGRHQTKDILMFGISSIS